MIARFRTLIRDRRGSVVIETAFVLPVLATLAFGGFEVSRIVARNNELQAAAAEAATVVMANPPEDQTDRDTIEAIVEASTGLATDKITMRQRFRCNADTLLVAAAASCATGAEISEFIEIRMQDSYTPIWTSFGIGNTINFDITRRVQVS
ncbi:TadE/TadG family type IV pilus assembly protein [Erythrobacter mangrovi]|uniref:Pilus assembly protein n=1 Tax=Erythrobacter mangrovi TaxID=2739433 RepID=A0A7D3XIY7_9SPHN|nr:TadE/TadG family type IV pilus assembly protein [Erythrobacter mangrovi]QKG71619.1 pilus assembly protein [Erythrobacter mangrovi]